MSVYIYIIYTSIGNPYLCSTFPSFLLINPTEEMRLAILVWLLIFCGQAIPNMAFQEIPNSQCNNFTQSEAVKHVQVHGPEGKAGFDIRDYRGNCELFHSMKGQKGGHGSSNIVHRPGPRQKSGATLLTAKPAAFFLSATVFAVALALGIINFSILSL
ncbi:uncharacterized protein LOC8280260 [Ricinus communis]|uniref:uncharacterized protein LOC8280260 n=1 Tax=Ricinus communis TaxID=3988 RepID=UPI00201B23E8|nr:uncharacterized protein LOC8280260 [Ricinus communis]